MKFTLFIALLMSSSAFARQYIQCGIADAGSTDVMVVNLQDPGKQSTLFISSGMQNPEDERILVNIEFDKEEGPNTIFKVVNEAGMGSVSLPTVVIGKPSNSFKVSLNFSEYSFDYVCFSRIYNE